MGLTEGSNIHKRSVISNGGDKEEVDIAESSEKHEGEDDAVSPSTTSTVFFTIFVT